SYTPGSTGKVSAVIVDSVLYEGSGSGSTISGGGGSIDDFEVSGTFGNNASLEWDDYDDASSYTVRWEKGGASDECGTTSNTNIVCSGLPSGNVKFTVTSNNGGYAETYKNI